MAIPGIQTTEITKDKVINVVCRYYDTDRETLDTTRRDRKLILPRQIIHYLLREHFPKMSLEKIGAVGNKHYATVLNSIRVIQNYLETDRNFRRQMKQIENNLESF